MGVTKDSSVDLFNLADLNAAPTSAALMPAAITEALDEDHGAEVSSADAARAATRAALAEADRQDISIDDLTIDGDQDEQARGLSARFVRLEVDVAAETAEVARKDSKHNIVPVASAIAMCPRTPAMQSALQAGEYDVLFADDSRVLGMYLEKIDGDDLCVTSFPRGVHGELFGAEKSGRIALFDSLLQANGHPLQHYQVDRALKMIKAQSRPLILRFRRSTRVAQLVDMGFAADQAVRALQQSGGDVQAAANLCFERR